MNENSSPYAPFVFSSRQEDLIRRPLSGSLFVEGAAGSGKTSAAAARLFYMIEQGIPAESILVITPQRTLAIPYYDVLQQPDLPAGGRVDVLTFGGLAQRMVDLFWPVAAQAAGFAHPDRPPVFLTLETAQYYLARLVAPLIEEQNYFESVRIDRNRLISQVLDNLNKAALVGFDHTTLAERLKAAWSGRPEQLHVYDEAQDCAVRFRRFCLENNLLDFSLQLEVFLDHLWRQPFCRSYLTKRCRHLIYDNLEEDVPVAHDLIRDWLPDFESVLLIFDTGGGYRRFLGSDPVSGYSLKAACQDSVTIDDTWVTAPPLLAFEQALVQSIRRELPETLSPDFLPAFTVSYKNFMPEMSEAICQDVYRLVHQEGVPPGGIAILSPYLSDALRFSLMNRLQQLDVAARSHRPSRSLGEEPATHCLLALAKLAHPDWKLWISTYDLRYALMQSISGMDLMRADYLAKVVYRPKKPQEGLGSFDMLRAEPRGRITYAFGERYERLRRWLADYMRGAPVELDVFISRLFGEVLSQPGFGFHDKFDAAAVAARLVESVGKFRRGVGGGGMAASPYGERSRDEVLATGLEYVHMVESGVIAAQYFLDNAYLDRVSDQAGGAVLISPAFSFLMVNRPVSYQFWLDTGSISWWERLNQPLTHPAVLSRGWGEGKWTDAHDVQFNQAQLERLCAGLLNRCRRQVFLCATGVNEQGDTQRGPLLQAVQSILRRLPAVPGEGEA